MANHFDFQLIVWGKGIICGAGQFGIAIPKRYGKTNMDDQQILLSNIERIEASDESVVS